MTSKSLKEIEHQALQAIKSLTMARTAADISANNVRAVSCMFDDVANELRRHALDMDERDRSNPS